MNILGENYVKLIGKIKYKEVNTYQDYLSFRCKLAVPINEEFQYVKVSAWGPLAESLSELPNDTWIKIHGHIEESSFDSKCKYCRGLSKTYWTSVGIDSYIIL